MKKSDYEMFKELVIKSHFKGDIMCAGYAWLQLTDKQIKEIKELAVKHADVITFYPNGNIQVGRYILK